MTATAGQPAIPVSSCTAPTLARLGRDNSTALDDAAAAKALAEAKQLVADGPDKPFLDLFFTDAATGFVTGAYGMILHTGDAGHSWQPWTAYVDNRNGAHLYALKSGAKRLYLAGEQGYFAVSE